MHAEEETTLGSIRKAISVSVLAAMLASLVATAVAGSALAAGTLTGVTSDLAGQVVGTTITGPQDVGSAVTATDIALASQPNAFALTFPTGTDLTGVTDWKVTLAGGASGCPTGTFDFANLGNNFVYNSSGNAVEFWTTNSCADQTVTLAIGAGSMVLPPADGAMSVTTYAGPMPGIDTTTYVMTWSTGTVVDTGSVDMGLVGPATQLAFTGYPTSPSTTDLGTITVAVQDASGTTITSDNATAVTLATNQDAGSFACTGAGGLTETAVDGVATFTGCAQTTLANGYTVTASATGLPDTTGASFDVTSGPATQIHLWWIIPVGSPAGTWRVGIPFSWQPGVEIEDAQGQAVTSDSSTQVTLSLTSAPSGGALTCTGGPTMTVTAGWAYFDGCWVNIAGAYTLMATSSPQGWTYSRTFTATAPPPAPAPTPQVALAVSATPTSLTGSGSATYTYSVSNPGLLALSGVTVTDSVCTPAYVGGDTNQDGLLEPGESWTYSCTATLSTTTIDAARASGTADGVTVSASASTTVTVTPAPALTPVTLTDGIAAGVDRGTSGFGTKSLVVLPNHYVTVLGRTSPNLAGSIVQVWVKTKTGAWHRLTSRLVAADGTVHYFARVNGWTGYWLRFAGDATHAPASSHGRIATNRS